MFNKVEKCNKKYEVNQIGKLESLAVFIEETNDELVYRLNKQRIELEALRVKNRMQLQKLYLLLNLVVFRKNSESFAKPPKIAEYILYLFIPKANRNAILGDLEEDYREVYKKFGLKKAQFFYWWQLIISIWPFISAGILKLTKLLYNGIITKLSVGK
ncbi:permease prefix domain 2-containing transporter [Methylomonas rosea]|uniref:Permease prefix domain 2-containing transporter n=1 Tax=Methylomonas rosea TaxID=2952227 RepID=A0ABT1TTV9_9GAMM|nr:permease prefix domain 2-containing transporter [Methylomonas sp. WSC-7]MCQ8118212.1 permease prefix domain 2-containing transporter [Methylomonas sp. WSC-7]